MQHFAHKVNRCSRAFLEPWDKCLFFNIVEVATQVLARSSPAKSSSWHGPTLLGVWLPSGARDGSQSDALGDTSFLRCAASAVSRDELAAVQFSARLH